MVAHGHEFNHVAPLEHTVWKSRKVGRTARTFQTKIELWYMNPRKNGEWNTVCIYRHADWLPLPRSQNSTEFRLSLSPTDRLAGAVFTPDQTTSDNELSGSN